MIYVVFCWVCGSRNAILIQIGVRGAYLTVLTGLGFIIDPITMLKLNSEQERGD